MSYIVYRPMDELWLTTIPKHWDNRKIKYAFSERAEKGYPDEPLLVASQNMGVVPKEVYGNRTVEATKDLHNLKLVCVGDFVISLRSFQGGLEYAYYQGIISPAYTVMIPNDYISSGYFRFLAKSRLFIELLQMCVTGIREGQNIDYSKLKNHLIPLPPRDEQDQIVRYLNWKVSQINKLINAKRRQIVLLQEQKRVVINAAVTRDGGSWQHLRIKVAANILRGKFSHRPRNDPAFYDGDYPFIQTGDVARANKYIQEHRQTLNEKGYSVSKQFPKGTLTMTIAANIGDVAILDFDACFPDSIIGFVPHDGVDLEYLYYALFNMKDEFVREAPVNTQGNLNVERVGAMVICIPNEDEQREIVMEIEAQTQRIDRFIYEIQTEITLFTEYRTRLISDVVTGKLDVRGVVVPEYEVAEDFAADEGVVETEETEDE